MVKVVTLTSQSFKDRIAEFSNVCIIDLRTNLEIAATGKPSLNGVDYLQLPWPAESKLLVEWFQSLEEEADDYDLLVLICKGGARAAYASEFLEEFGHKDLIELTDGYTGWSESQE